MNWADVEEIVYAESTHPGRILGAHLIPEGLLIQAFFPNAKAVFVRLKGREYSEMELADESGFYAILLPKGFLRKGLPEYHFKVRFDNDTELLWEDPYRFSSGFSEEDASRFNNGVHYEIYDKMGAHPGKRNGVKGVEFTVFAPHAMRVSVVGDFNNWDGRRHQMERITESGVYSLFIPGLASGEIYKYEIKCKAQEPFLKTDPYGFAFELRPNTAAVVADLSGFVWHDEAWEKKKKKGHQTEEAMSVYELHLGSVFRKKPELHEDGKEVNGSCFYNYRELARMVAKYVREEGYTHVELLPVMEHPLDQSWGYQVSGYYAPTSRYGTPEDFQFFVDYLHGEGIGVILDWVPAHFPRDSWGLAQFDGSSLFEDPDPNRASHPHWGTLIFHYARHEISNFLIGSAFFFAKKYHVDGIRMDAVASMLYLDYGRDGGDAPRNIYGGNENLESVEFFKHLNSQFHEHFPGTLLIAEESTAWPKITTPVKDGGLGFDLKWNMGWMNDFLSYMETDPLFRKGSYGKLTFSMLYHYSENFQLVFSHDEVVHGKGSMFSRMPSADFSEKAQNLRAAYGYFFSHPGKKLLFMGQDFGQNDEWSEEREVEWGLLQFPVHHGIHEYVKDMNMLYQSHPALWKLDYDPDGFQWINCSYQDLSILIFLRKTEKPEETLLIVTNLDNTTQEKFLVGLPFPCELRLLISSDEKKYGGKGLQRKISKKSRPVEWDEQKQSAAVTIPAMSTSIYQLTPVAEKKAVKTVRKKRETTKTTKNPAARKPAKKAAAMPRKQKEEQ